MILAAIDRLEREWGLEGLEFSFYPSRAKLDTVKVFRAGELVAVLKVGEDAGRVRDVHGKLERVARATEGTPIESSTPEPLLLSVAEEASFVAESALGGRSSEKALKEGGRRRRRTARLLERVVDWLVAFHAAFPTADGGPGDLPELPEATGLEPETWHVGPMHGDFVTSNVLVDGSEVRVIDWDEFRERGCPAVDLLYFLVDVAGKHSPEPFSFTFYERNWYSELAREAADAYCAGTGVDRSSLLDHIPLYLAISRPAASAHGQEAWRRRLEELMAVHTADRVVWR